MWGLHGIVASRAGAGSEFFSQIDNLVWEREFHKGERNFPWGPPRAAGESKERGKEGGSEGSVLHFTDRGGPWRATVPRGRNPDHATQKTDATERVPPRKNQWRAMLCHGRNSCADNPEPFGRDHRRRACVHKDPRFPAGQMADATERLPSGGAPWRATVPRGRNPDDAGQKTDATERVPPWKNQWRAMLRHGRKSCADNPEPFGRDHRRKACVHKGPRLHAGQKTDATERVPPGKNRWRAMRCHGRESCADNPEPFGRDHRRRACVHKDPRLHAGQMADATERVPPWKNQGPGPGVSPSFYG